VRAIDLQGHRTDIYTFTDTIDYTLPEPQFIIGKVTIPAGKVNTLQFYDDKNTKDVVYTWDFAKLSDTVTDKMSMDVEYQDATEDTLIVTGTIFGFAGKPETLVITAVEFTYIIEEVVFPDTVATKYLTQFIVRVQEGTGSGPYDSAEYIWHIEPDSVSNLAVFKNDTCELKLDRKTGPFLISVYAIVDTTYTTNTIRQKVFVEENTPFCRFDADTFTAPVGDSVSFEFSATDNDSIAAIYMRFGSDTDSVSIPLTSPYRKVFTEPGRLKAYIWAYDNIGLRSYTDSAEVYITKDNPSFNPLTGEDTIFVNDSLTITVHADPGNSVSTITDYFWDTDGDGVWDDTLPDSTYSLFFPAPGTFTVYVGCMNNFGDTALDHYTHTVEVDSGVPQILSDSLSRDTVYINDSVRLFIEVYDTNNIVKEAHIDTSKDGTADITIQNIDSRHTTVSQGMVFMDPGDYGIDIWIKDSTGYYSDTSSLMLTVLSGEPVIDSVLVSPGTAYIYDTVTFTVYGSDNKGIEKYY
jgi:hypothetical protein